MTALSYTLLSTPIGDLIAAGDAHGLRHIRFADRKDALAPEDGWSRDRSLLSEAAAQLRSYFAGELRAFELALAPEGTAFQLAVWRALAEIPYGETVSYGEVARRIARPDAVRAVGAANGANPLPIVLPCHRVIGSDGSLTGYGGGLERKKWLLMHERSVADLQRRLFL